MASALAAETFPDLDRDRVVVSGGSYGGGESWLRAMQPDWTFPRSADPSLPVLKLKVAVPKYGWSDLAYSLAPHGRGNPYTAAAGRAGEQPIGVVKPLLRQRLLRARQQRRHLRERHAHGPDGGGRGADKHPGLEEPARRRR